MINLVYIYICIYFDQYFPDMPVWKIVVSYLKLPAHCSSSLLFFPSLFLLVYIFSHSPVPLTFFFLFISITVCGQFVLVLIRITKFVINCRLQSSYSSETKRATISCPRSSYPFYTVSFYIKWVTTSWTYSTS